MTIRRIALQAATANMTQNQAITVDANGLLQSAGLLTYAYLQNISTTDKVLGRATAGAGVIEEIACTAQGRAILALATGIDYAKLQNVSATDKVLGRATAGAGVIEEIACTAAGRALLDDADAAAQRTTLNLGTIATQAANSVSITGGAISGITDLAVADGGTGSSTAAAARLALGMVDANDRVLTAMLSTKLIHSYWHAAWNERTVVAGTWAIANSPSQTDFDDAINSSAGRLVNTSLANNDEIHFGNITLNAGTYKVTMAYIKVNESAIIELLHGTTSLGTQDSYAAVTAYNQVVSFTYSPTTRVTGNLRLKASGKNASSSAYACYVSRIEIIRTG